MKAKRRHELKENVLAHELAQVKEFANRYGTWILIVLAAATICYVGYKKYRTSRLNEYAEEKSRYNDLVFSRDVKLEERAKGLTDLFETAKDPTIAAAAGLEAGETWVHMYMDTLVSSPGATGEEAEKYVQNGRQMFERVLKQYPNQLRAAAGAEQGLALLYDNMAMAAINAGDKAAADEYVDKAEKHYREVARLLGPNDPATRVARARIEALKKLEPIRFATTLPSAQTQPASAPAPATAPAPAPASAPAPK